jgi:SAM-dependent methyltransferase
MVAIDSEDPLPYYYSRLTGWGYRKRLSMAVSLVGGQNYGSLLEIGYGSGIFLPELASHCQKLTAVDTHRKAALVSTMLASEGIEARLLTGDIRALPLPDECFDGVVCLSVLEHLLPHDLAHAVAEVRRVAKPRAVVVFGYPLRNVFTDSFFQLVRFAARDLHPSSHQDIQTAVAHGLSVERVVRFPMWLPEHLSWYVALRCTRND